MQRWPAYQELAPTVRGEKDDSRLRRRATGEANPLGGGTGDAGEDGGSANTRFLPSPEGITEQNRGDRCEFFSPWGEGLFFFEQRERALVGPQRRTARGCVGPLWPSAPLGSEML